MKVVYFSASSIPSRTANSVHVVKMASAIADNGCSVRLFAKDGDFDSSPFEFYGVKKTFDIEFISEPNFGPLGRAIYAFRAVRQLKISGFEADLVFGRDLGSVFLASKLGLPFMFEVHDVHPGFIGRYLVEKLVSCENCRGVVAISDALKKDLVATLPSVHDRDVWVAHDAADDPLDRQQGKLCEYLDRSVPTVGYVGHLYRGKGMEVIASIANKLKNVQFEIIGGTTEDIANWNQRISLSNVRFHGFVPHRELSSRYPSLDLCLLPIQRKIAVSGGIGDIGKWTSPLKLFEYMSYGMPIVASNVPVLREVLTNRLNAILVDPEDVEGWATAIDELIADSELRARLGRRAREDFLAKYSWRSRAGNILSWISG